MSASRVADIYSRRTILRLAWTGRRSARLNESFEGLASTAGGMKNLLRAVFYGVRIIFGF